MKIDPKTFELDAIDRSALRSALRAGIASEQRRMNRLRSEKAMDECADRIARWSDLARRFSR